MSDTSPNSLEPTKTVNAARMSKWPLYAVLLTGLFLLGILVYSVNFAHNQEEEQGGTPKVDIKEEEKPLLMGEGRGLALAPPAGSPAVMQPDRPGQNGASREPLIVVQSDKGQSDNYRQELENLRRMKAQAHLTALSAPLGVKKASQTNTAPVFTPVPALLLTRLPCLCQPIRMVFGKAPMTRLLTRIRKPFLTGQERIQAGFRRIPEWPGNRLNTKQAR